MPYRSILSEAYVPIVVAVAATLVATEQEALSFTPPNVACNNDSVSRSYYETLNCWTTRLVVGRWQRLHLHKNTRQFYKAYEERTVFLLLQRQYVSARVRGMTIWVG